MAHQSIEDLTTLYALDTRKRDEQTKMIKDLNLLHEAAQEKREEQIRLLSEKLEQAVSSLKDMKDAKDSDLKNHEATSLQYARSKNELSKCRNQILDLTSVINSQVIT